MNDLDVEQMIRVQAALRIRDFEEWVGTNSKGDDFGEIPWLEVVTAASLALTAVDKNLKTADEVIGRLLRLYRSLIKKQQTDETMPATLSERLIVLLADERARHGRGLTVETLSELTMSPTEKVAHALERLRSLSVVVETKQRWMLRTSRGS